MEGELPERKTEIFYLGMRLKGKNETGSATNYTANLDKLGLVRDWTE